MKEEVDNGYCITLGSQKKCYCIPGFIGELCKECEDKSIDGVCYKSDDTSNGDCYVGVKD